MNIEHLPIQDGDYQRHIEESRELAKTRCINDLLRNANTGMMSWAEKNFKHKLIDKLYELGYYEDNQTIYLKDKRS